MKRISLVLAVGLLSAACTNNGGAPRLGDFPSEFDFFASVVGCTEDRTGREFGDMTEDALGLASAEARHTLDAAANQEEPVYLQCFQDMLPVVPEIEPVTGYGDYSDVAYSEVDRFETTALIVKCANDHGYPVVALGEGDGIGGFGASGVHLHNMAAAVVHACRAGLNLPSDEN